jgi:TDG/mug DNA glycosylase family protein
MGFTRAELQAFRDVAVPDLIDDQVRLLFVGINPGLWTAATQTHFAHPGNRFYPALLAAGVIDVMPDFARAMTDAERSALLARGIGISNLVNRATARADELSRDELRGGADRLRDTVRRRHPAVVAVVGVTAYRLGFDQPRAAAGEQPAGLEGARLWVVPNPSGLNAHDTVATLAAAYAEPARAAGLLPAQPAS